MKKRHLPGVERLEARETPDVSLGSAAACPAPPAGTDMSAVGAGLVGEPQNFTSAADPTQLANDLTGLETILVQQHDDFKNVLSSHNVKALFADAHEVDNLLAGSAQLLADSPDSRNAAPPRAPDSAEPQGWQFLYNYTRKAIRNAELKYGPLADHEDMIHEVFVDWREQVGQGDKAYAELLNQESAERLTLRKTVRRVIDQTRYEQTRQRRAVELFDQAAPVVPCAQDWLDLQIDWSLGVGKPGPRERQLLELRRQGMTFEEIGSEMGMLKQRVCEVYNSAVRRLYAVYGQ
jgi:hypothetical protein